MKIAGSIVGEIDCKRFHMKGLQINDDCPRCGNESSCIDEYLSYPYIERKPNTVYFDCEKCNTNWHRKLRLTVTLREWQ